MFPHPSQGTSLFVWQFLAYLSASPTELWAPWNKNCDSLGLLLSLVASTVSDSINICWVKVSKCKNERVYNNELGKHSLFYGGKQILQLQFIPISPSRAWNTFLLLNAIPSPGIPFITFLPPELQLQGSLFEVSDPISFGCPQFGPSYGNSKRWLRFSHWFFSLSCIEDESPDWV